MPDSTCTFLGCEQKPRSLGLCVAHYRQKWLGKPLSRLKRDVSAMERFDRFVHRDGPINPETNTPCHQWIGHLDKDGYGVFWADGRNVRAHRFAWESRFGPIPTGNELDHDYPGIGCHNKACVNVEHLRPVTDNITRKHNNTSGEPNISWNATWNYWSVRVGHMRKQKSPALIGLPANYPGSRDVVPQAAIHARDKLRAHLGLTPIRTD